MAARDSTSNAFTESEQARSGTEKIDQVRALIAGAMAMLDDDESEKAVDGTPEVSHG